MSTMILDVDGVLLNWNAGFFGYMESIGNLAVCEINEVTTYDLTATWPDFKEEEINDLIRCFNNSPSFHNIPAMPDAVFGIRNLRTLLPNWNFIILSSCGVTPNCVTNRIANLRSWFDEFDEVHIRDLTENKADKMCQLGTDFVLIDDSPRHLDAAADFGGLPICFDQPYNRNWKGWRLDNWREITFVIENLQDVGLITREAV